MSDASSEQTSAAPAGADLPLNANAVHVYIDPARLAHAPDWSAAAREAGFDLRLTSPLDLARAAGPRRCLYRGEETAITCAHASLDEAALTAAGIDPTRPLRLTFHGEAVATVPALILAAVVCARLEGVLIDPAPADAGAARVDALAAITWATDLEVLADEQYRRVHDGQAPPALLAGRRAQRRTVAITLAVLIILPALLYAGLRVQAHYAQKEEERQTRALLDERARWIAQEEYRQELARRAAAQAANEAAQAARAAAQAKAAAFEAKLASLSDADYRFTPAEAPGGVKRWLFGHRQEGGFYAFEAAEQCGDELRYRDPGALRDRLQPAPGAAPVLAVTVPASALAPLQAARMHLPQTWTMITTEEVTQIDMRAAAAVFHTVGGPCLYLLTAPFEAKKEAAFFLQDHTGWTGGPHDQLALAFPGEVAATPLSRAEAGPVMLEEAGARARHQAEVIDGLSALKTDPRMRAVVSQMLAEQQDHQLQPVLAGYQEFRAMLFPGRGNEAFRFYYYRGETRILWCLVRLEDKKLLNVSTLDSGYFPSVLATLDVDGDGAEELLIRALIYEGELLKLFKVDAGKLRVLGESSYIGI